MDRRELNKMFDGLAPAPGREEELLEKLLQGEVRRTRPVKNWKRIVVAAAAAAILVTAATAAAVAPQLGGALGKLLEVGPKDTRSAELLAPGAMTVDITTESNGATLHITQVLRNKMDIVVVGEFATAEGTVLDTGDCVTSWKPDTFRGKLPIFLDANGEVMELNYVGSRRAFWWSMPDGDPLDNRCLVYYVYRGDSEDLTENVAAMRVDARNFAYYVGGEHENYTTIPGDWSFDVPLPQHDIGYVCKTDETVALEDGTKASLRKVYLCPMALEVTYLWEDEPEDCVISKAILTDKTGNSVALDWWEGGGGRDNDEKAAVVRFMIADYIAQDRKGDYIDPADFQGGVLTLEWRMVGSEPGSVSHSATFSLDGLEPVSP